MNELNCTSLSLLKYGVIFVVLDAVEVKNGIYGEDPVLGCGVPDNSSTELTFHWLKDGHEVHSDKRRVISLHKYPDYSTLNFSKIGNSNDSDNCL